MPLTEKGEKIMRGMKQEYGPEKGEQVFYASKNKGRIKGVDAASTRRAPYDRKRFLVRMRDALRAGHGLQAAIQDAITADHALAFRDFFRDAVRRGVPVQDAIAGAQSMTQSMTKGLKPPEEKLKGESLSGDRKRA